MQSVQTCGNQNKRNLVWVDGDTIVRLDGEKILNDEINGSGYTAKLNAFIAQREKALKEFEAKYKKNSVEVELGLE